MRKISVLIFVSVFSVVICAASQDSLIDITGRVFHKVEKLVDGERITVTEPWEFVHVYALPDLSGREKFFIREWHFMSSRFDFWEFFIEPMYGRPYREGMTDRDGVYTIRNVPKNGCLVFVPYHMAMGELKFLAIDGQSKAEDIVYDNYSCANYSCAMMPIFIEPTEERADFQQIGRNLSFKCRIVRNKSCMQEQMRLTITPYYIECRYEEGVVHREDTTYLVPITYYGDLYERLQNRRYALGLPPEENDTLSLWFRDIEYDENDFMKLDLSVELPDSKKHYEVKVRMTYKDFNHVWEERDVTLKPWQNNKPMRLLEKPTCYGDLYEIADSSLIESLTLCMDAEEYDDALACCASLPEGAVRDTVEAFVRCLNGEFDNDKYAGLIERTSYLNRAVVCLARKDYYPFMVITDEILDEKDPRKFYLRALYKSQDYGLSSSEDELLRCFKLDNSYIDVARSDAVLLKVFPRTEKRYYEWKRRRREVNQSRLRIYP